jgi:Zn-dependent peptidase ImmA (M78 family)
VDYEPPLRVCAGVPSNDEKRDRVEQLADRFARRLLMPPDPFVDLLRLMVKSDGSIDLIGVARYFGVNV